MTPLSDKKIKELGYQIKKEDTIFIKNGKLDIKRLEKTGTVSGSIKPRNYQYEGYLKDGTHIYISGNSKSGYIKNIRMKKDLFEFYYEYYSSGFVKLMGKLYINEFAKGTWYDFNEHGDIEKYEDYDAPYDFSWKDVQNFLEENKIQKEEILSIHRSNRDGTHKWAILFKPKEFLKTDNAKFIHLDGKTGKILKTGIYSTARELD